MENVLGTLTTKEFEEMVEKTIDKRLSVWLTQLMDALIGLQDEDNSELQPEFASSLRRSIEQASYGESVDLESFREQIE